MSVQACVSPKMTNRYDDDDDDDDKPLVFKRTSKISKPSQTETGLQKSTSQRPDGQSGKAASDVRSSKLQNSSSQKVKQANPPKETPQRSPAPTPKDSTSSAGGSAMKSPSASPKLQNSSSQKVRPVNSPKETPQRSPAPSQKYSTSSAGGSAMKSPSASPKASTSSYKAPPMKSTVGHPKASSESDKSKTSSRQSSISTIKEEKQAINSGGDSDDSDDDQPLSVRLPSASSKGNSQHPNNGSKLSTLGSPPPQKPEVKPEDSDDEIPLSSKFQVKSSAPSSSKSGGYNDRKPIIAKNLQNGATTIKDNQQRVVSKRPLDEVKSPSQSSVKRPKLDESLGRKLSSPKTEAKSDDDEDDHIPISQRMKTADASGSKSSSVKQKMTKVVSTSSFKKTSKTVKKVVKKSNYSKSSKVAPGSGDGQKWTTLVHNGVIFPPPYTPHGVKILYKGKPVDLTPAQEEVATMFAVMLETEYMNKDAFKINFMKDWKKILGPNHVIQRLEDCDFTPIYEWHQKEKEKKKQMSSEEKKALKEEKMKVEEKYMWATVDGVKEKVGNFRVEPPGLFRGRGDHPKMGRLKTRIRPSDITINIGKDAPVPECPIPGERWKEIRHDNTVTWLAFWNDPINPKEFKYVFLAASSSLKGQSDKEKYEKARLLKDYIQGIRSAYTKGFTSQDVTKRQIAVATYLIDKLALRAGNEKDDEEADTVGCCTLKVENVEPIPPNVLKFDFLGKDSIRYQNEVEVELPAFKAIQQFRKGKKGNENLFDQLDTSKLNAHLKELMPGLTAKVFRTYNASFTLDDMLSRETKGGELAENIVVYNQANKEVAIICNHQRSVSKTHSAQISKLNEKIDELKGVIDELKDDLDRAKRGKAPSKGSDGKPKRNLQPEALERKIAQTSAKIEKMERDKETKEDLKTVALGTSKINYLDPRITVAWCKRHDVPIEKIFNKSLIAKFAWAMDVEPDFRF